MICTLLLLSRIYTGPRVEHPHSCQLVDTEGDLRGELWSREIEFKSRSYRDAVGSHVRLLIGQGKTCKGRTEGVQGERLGGCIWNTDCFRKLCIRKRSPKQGPLLGDSIALVG